MLNTYRDRMIAQFAEAGVPFIESRIVSTAGTAAIGGPLPVWVKRADVHNTQEGDVVFAATEDAVWLGARRARRARHRARRAPAARRGRSHEVLRDRARRADPTGEPPWFRWFYHKGQRLAGHPLDRRRLAGWYAERRPPWGSRCTGATPSPRRTGDLVLLDLNAWPSFALYRDEAAVAIAVLPDAALPRRPRDGAAASPGRDRGRSSQQERRHMAPGLQSFAQYAGLAMARGAGSMLYDEDGNEYIDFIAGIAVGSVGHCHPHYVEALKRQVERLTFGSFTTETRARFLDLLATLTPEGLTRIQMFSGGAEAVEAALRLAKAATGKHEIIGFWGGFHGKTGGVLGLLGSDFKHHLGPFLPGQYLSPYADCYRCPLRLRYPDCGIACADYLRDVIRYQTARRDRRDHRRAHPGHGRQRGAARGLPARGAGHRAGARRAADRRRDDQRLRADGRHVGRRATTASSPTS